MEWRKTAEFLRKAWNVRETLLSAAELGLTGVYGEVVKEILA